jgi:hypothetical protein
VVRLAPILLAGALVSAAGCRADTIRTTNAPSTTGASVTSSTKPRAGSTTTKHVSGASTTTAATGSSTTAGGGAASAVVLSGSNLGPTALGTPADEAVSSMRKALGAPSRDLPDPGATCPGPERMVSWGRLSLYFTGGKLAGWGYASTPAGPPQLSTPSGITIGSTVATLRRVYGTQVKIHAADSPFPAGFSVPVSGGDLTGTLTGTGDSDTTTSLAYGVSCGE